MSKILVNENQLRVWIQLAERIKDSFGIDRALGYLIGERFYDIVSTLHSCQELIRTIDEERKKPDYKPIGVTISGNRKLVTNLHQIYKREVAIITETNELLAEFATLIKQAFHPYEICNYFESNPRLGTMAQIASDEEYEFLVGRGIVEHSLDTEIEDALIFGDMMKYFGVS